MQGLRVLLVEDDFMLNLSLSESLQEAGFLVESVYCGEAAFEVIQKHRELSALVTDVELGPGADGFAVARRARAAYPGLPVIYVSATSSGRHAGEGVAGSTFTAKPFDPGRVTNELCGMVRRTA